MEIRIRSTGQVMYESEFRSLHPNTSFPTQINEALLNDMGADVVFEGAQASTSSPYHYSMRQGVEQVNGKWYTKYVLGPIFIDYRDEEGVLHSIEEQETAYKANKDAEQAKAVRASRDIKLAETDWMVIKSAETGIALSNEWSAYRQALRDVTAQSTFPWNVVWPTKPE
jgi:hypothetical protein